MTEEIALETTCVMVGMLGIENKTRGKEDWRDWRTGRNEMAHHQLLASGLPCIHNNRLRDILYPTADNLQCLNWGKTVNRQADHRSFVF